MTKNPHQIRCSILPIVWTRAQFEQGDRNIIGYAKQLIKQNHLKGINVDRDDVAHNWWWLVDHVFAKGDTRREQFMSQTHCPSFHEFWAERDTLNGIFEDQDQAGFQRVQHDTTRAERKAHPGVVVLLKDGIETLLPGMDYAPLRSIKYRAFSRAVLEANQARNITLAEMQLLWDAMVHKVFRFECACAKESKANESMGVDGFSQAQYDQLILDIRSGVPPPRPSLMVALPLPRIKHSRKRKSTNSRSDTDSDETRAAEEDNSSIAQRQRRRSKRAHRSGPGDDYGIPGYPLIPSAGRVAPRPRGQLPSLPSIFTAPVTTFDLTLRPEHEWLDPQLHGQPGMQEDTVEAVDNRLATSTVLGPKETYDTVADSGHEVDDEEEIGAWSL